VRSLGPEDVTGAAELDNSGPSPELRRYEMSLYQLGELAAGSVNDAVEALVERNESLARLVIDRDDAIDALHLKIDQGVLSLMGSLGPTDLRLASTLLHCCPHLERIGDQAVNVAKLCLVTTNLPTSDTLRSLVSEMGTIAVTLVRVAMESLAKRDLELCLSLSRLDDPIDRLNRATHLEALKLADDHRALDWAMHMNMAARALERVGDNAVDIAEQVSYLLTGEFHEFTDASHADA
jgi:phosphate transport system protein